MYQWITWVSHFQSLYMFRNLHFLCLIMRMILILSCVETNPGPNSNSSDLSIKPLSIVHNNVCILLPKLDIIATELSMYDVITIYLVKLTWMKSISNKSISINGFHQHICQDRNRYGCGVAIFISDKLAFYERKDLEIQELEIICSEIHNHNKIFLVGS